MEKLTPRKQMGIIRQYLAGFSYKDIAAREGVSLGTVANIVSDLKAGRMPEVQEAREQLEVLREVALDLHRLKLTPAQAAVGIATFAHLQEIGVEPDNVARWAAMCREWAAQGQVEAPSLVKAAMAFDEERRRTGLSAEALEQKAAALEKAVERLKPAAKELEDCQGRLAKAKREERALADNIAKLQDRRESLRGEIAQKEKRESELSKRVLQLESRGHGAEERLAAARRDEQALNNLGLSREGLSGFVDRIAGIASRHGIAREAMLSRLLHELEQLERGLGIESLVQCKQEELAAAEQKLAKLEEAHEGLETSNRQLRREQAELHAAITEEQKRLRQGMKAAARIAEEAAIELRKRLADEMSKAVAEVESLTSGSLKLGREIGRFEEVMKGNDFVPSLIALVRADGDVSAQQARIAGLTLTRGLSTWLAGHKAQAASVPWLETKIKSVIEELERWKA